MKLRAGIAGLGRNWESRYLPVIRTLADRFEVRGIFEPVAHRSERAAREFNAMAFDGFRALAACNEIDVILCLSDEWYGVAPVLAACDYGKAVYSAISLPLDAGEAARLRQRVDASGIAFMTELPRRHFPATLRLKELIATRLGNPRMLFCHRRVAVEQQFGSGSQDRGTESRDLMELVDWCSYVAGTPPTSVVAVKHAESHASQRDDYQMMSLDYSVDGAAGTGCLAQISCGYYIPQHWEEAVTFRTPAALQVACQNGIAFLDLPSSLVWFDTAGRHLESLESDRPVGEMMLAQFHRMVTSLVRHVSGLDDTLFAMRVVSAAAESQREGLRMRL